MQRRPSSSHSPRRRARDRRHERRRVADRRAASGKFNGRDRRRTARRQAQSRRLEDPSEFYPEEVERIRTNVVEQLRRHKKGSAPRFSCPRCTGFLTVHRPVRWAEVTVFEVTCSECPRRAMIKEVPAVGAKSEPLKNLMRRVFG